MTTPEMLVSTRFVDDAGVATEYVDNWPEFTEFGLGVLLRNGDGLLDFSNGVVVIRVTNGMAVYEVVSIVLPVTTCRRVYSEWRPF